MERIPDDDDDDDDDGVGNTNSSQDVAADEFSSPVDPPLGPAETAAAFGVLLDQIQDDLEADEDLEVFPSEEVVVAPDRTRFPPSIGLSLPPLRVDEFVSTPLNLDGYVKFTPRTFDVRNNGAIRFLVVSRPRGTVDWSIPSWLVASQVINAVQNECYDSNAPCLNAFHWANSWKGVGLISLYTSEEYVEAMKQFRAMFTSLHLSDFINMDFNTYPKDLLPCSEVKVLLKTPLKNFNPRHIPAALFNQNYGLSGSLRLHSSKPINVDVRSKKSEPRDGWRMITLKGNAVFFESLKKFPESFPFNLGCSQAQIRGGSGRVKAGTVSSGFKSRTPSSSSSSTTVNALTTTSTIPATVTASLTMSSSSASSSSTASLSSTPSSSYVPSMSSTSSSLSADRVPPKAVKTRGGKSGSRGKGRGRGFVRSKKSSQDVGPSSTSASFHAQDSNDQVSQDI